MKFSPKMVSLILALVGATIAPQFFSTIQTTEADIQAELERHAWQNSWAGNALQHTPFQDGLTTRFLLLKACAKSKVLASHLELSPEQLAKIEGLQALHDVGRTRKFQLEQFFDEELLDPDFYSFLSDRQMNRLDVLSFQLDGYSSLLRQSLKSGLHLSDETSKRAASVFADLRTSYVVPRGQQNFAAQHPEDMKYQNVWFDASTATFLNMKILGILDVDEKARLAKFLSDNSVSGDVALELMTICKLPNGVLSLVEYAELTN